MRRVLLDTGPFVALLDRSERNHKQCVKFLRGFEGQLITTEPVLTETIYLLCPSVKAQKASIDFILKGGAILIPQSFESLSRAKVLMGKYSNIPMDFADATLVVLAEDTGITEVFTLDRKGFSAYRIQGKKHFMLWP